MSKSLSPGKASGKTVVPSMPGEAMGMILETLGKHLPMDAMASIEGLLWVLQQDAERAYPQAVRIKELEAALASHHDRNFGYCDRCAPESPNREITDLKARIRELQEQLMRISEHGHPIGESYPGCSECERDKARREPLQ